MNGYLLDACALIAYLNDEQGADRVLEILRQGKVRITAVNLLEICYDVVRRTGSPDTGRFPIEQAAREGIQIVWSLTPDQLLIAARWKARGRLSLADAVALAVAETDQLRLVTADHHEFDPIEQQSGVIFEWIR